jgi:hypothetical protein
MMTDLEGLPGASGVEQGVRDLWTGQCTVEALLVASAVGRLRELGVPTSADVALPSEPELALYAALGQEVEDPYGRYNALRRELDSFLAALQARRARR